ncbi:RNA polymerase sigma-70 factor [Arcticibacter sp.]|uniref:RNA polymerase sigma-70 factor n=1 Tax=Arcticibacter sp. TaxID=1872630 RepID=UPI0038900A72
MNSYTDLCDKELILLLVIGDEPAFAEIYKRYWKRLLAIAYRHTMDKALAEEIVQEIFISLWTRREKLSIASLEAYLATAVKFSVYKSFYRQKRRSEVERGNCAKERCTLSEEQMEARFTQEYINKLVEQLPEKCKLVFKFSRNSGLNISEISREMGIAEKTVEAHLTKGLKMLRFNLKRAGFILLLHQWF